MSRSVRRLWPVLLLSVVLLAALCALPAARQAGAERQRQAAEAARLAGARRLLNSDPVRFEEYVRQVAIAADVIGDGQQDASGPCQSVSGFESGVGDPPPETASCVIRDPGEGHATVTLTLQDGRVFRWPREKTPELRKGGAGAPALALPRPFSACNSFERYPCIRSGITRA